MISELERCAERPVEFVEQPVAPDGRGADTGFDRMRSRLIGDGVGIARAGGRKIDFLFPIDFGCHEGISRSVASGSPGTGIV